MGMYVDLYMIVLQIAMFYADEDLPDHYTLTDVATLYGWRRV